jgi:glutamate racemase
MKYQNYIGVFDSGVGGISVLKELKKVLPNENYIFYGDSLNAPYGDKTKEEILSLSTNIVDYLINNGVKAIVIACNTATSAAAKELREKYPNIPIIGIEPAIKPAFLEHPTEDILVMATQATMEMDKFIRLKDELSSRYIIPIPCQGLADRIENNEDVRDLLDKYLSPYKEKAKVVVLGCTHYPFIKKEIESVIGDVEFYDGAKGTALNLKKQLELRNTLNNENKEGIIIFESSNNSEEKYKEFLNKSTED